LLGEVERFVFETMEVPFASARLELMRLKRSLAADLDPSATDAAPAVLAPLRGQVSTLAAAGRAIRISKSIPAVLRVILFAGNRLNAGTSKGKARGFKLSTLEKIRTAKTTGGLDGSKVSVLDVIARASANPDSTILPDGSKPVGPPGPQERDLVASPGG